MPLASGRTTPEPGLFFCGLIASPTGQLREIGIEARRIAGLAAGALSILTYGLALWAFRLGATPRLAALRETSILFGVLIAVVFLKEKATPARLAGVRELQLY